MTSPAMRPLSLTVPPETFSLVTTARMSFSDALVLRGIYGHSSTRRSSSLLASSRLRSLSRVAYPVRRLKMRSKRALSSAARSGLGRPERFELAIEPPDHLPGDFDGVALASLAGTSLWTRRSAWTQHSAWWPRRNVGVVGEDDGAAEPLLGAERAPERSFAGHAHGIGGDPQFGQAERAEMGVHSASQANSRTFAPLSASMTPWARLAARI